MNYPVVHIVRRYGQVGGMESYVWHLTHGLAEKKVAIYVICEEVFGRPDSSIKVVLVPKYCGRRRWRAMLHFRQSVEQFLATEFKGNNALIHSHERSLSHHITTFHGPPLRLNGPKTWIPRWFSSRIKAWKQMERDEVLGPNVKLVLAVSRMVEAELLTSYPELAKSNVKLAWPGCDPRSLCKAPISSNIGTSKKRFLFIGQEWKRKGLELAVMITECYRLQYQAATLSIYGPQIEEIPKWIRKKNWVNCRGWSSTIAWENFDLLIHPARTEPFGMVVSEARANGLPVLISDQVGALDLGFRNVRVHKLNDSAKSWALSIEFLLTSCVFEPEIKWRWSDLVSFHYDIVYGLGREQP